MIKTTVVLPQKGIFFTVFVFLMIAILIELTFKKVQENSFSHTSSLSHYEKIKKTELPKLLSVHGIIISESRHRIACRKNLNTLFKDTHHLAGQCLQKISLHCRLQKT